MIIAKSNFFCTTLIIFNIYAIAYLIGIGRAQFNQKHNLNSIDLKKGLLFPLLNKVGMENAL